MSFSKFTIGALMAVVTASACDVPNQSANQTAGGGGTANVPPAAPSNALYVRLNGDGGIRTVMKDFVTRVAGDSRINGYFMNEGINANRIIECLVLQVGALTGGPYQYPSLGCRDMKSVHTGMKVSQNDFNDTAGHLVGALTSAAVSQADINTIVGAVGAMAPDIIEDRGNNMTVYQRVGRKPAIEQVVVALMTDVYADPRIGGFFVGGDSARLRTCLTRMVCGIDGPCKHTGEVDGEPGVSAANKCKSMFASHQGINKPRAITKDDFNVLVERLVGVLDRAGVSATDKGAILGKLGPYCRDIVKDGTGC